MPDRSAGPFSESPASFSEWAGKLRGKLLGEGFTSDEAFTLVLRAADSEWF